MYIHHIRSNCDIFTTMFGYDEIKNIYVKKKKNQYLPLYIDFKLNLLDLGINCDVILDL